MKGIVLAGGAGTRLHPLTTITSKQLLPVYDKPMVHYPLGTLMLGGIREILLISTPQDLPNFKKLLGDGSKWGITIEYAEQPKPEGIAQAFIIGAPFIGKDSATLVLGDNIFYGQGLGRDFSKRVEENAGATIFVYRVTDAERYGVAEFDDNGVVVGIEEKPKAPKSKYAVTGLYIYDNDVVEIARNLKPSGRGELEITDVNKAYLQQGRLKAHVMSRGSAWLDTGTHESLLDAANFVAVVEKRQGLKISCLEEIAYRKGFIDANAVRAIAEPLMNSEYGKYLMNVITLHDL